MWALPYHVSIHTVTPTRKVNILDAQEQVHVNIHRNGR